MREEQICIRLNDGEMLAVEKACEKQSRTISNFVRVAIRGECLDALGVDGIDKITRSVKESKRKKRSDAKV
jgi:hypothetical protein